MSTIDQIFDSAKNVLAEASPKAIKPLIKRPVGRPSKASTLLKKRQASAAIARAARAKKKSGSKKTSKKTVSKLSSATKRPVGRPAKNRRVGRPAKKKTAKAVKGSPEVRAVQSYVTPVAKIEALAGVARAVGILMQFGIKECLRQKLPATVILVAVGETAGLVASMMGVPYSQAAKSALSGIQGAYKGRPVGSVASQAKLLPGSTQRG